MGKQFEKLSIEQKKFISDQKMFFVGTAASTGKVNISPKGMDSFRVLDEKTVLWLNLTGSGNETSAHVQELPRMTIMFCAFTGKPEILRLYGKSEVLHKGNSKWSEYLELFSSPIGARQLFILNIELVQSSCGFSVPLYEYQQDRKTLLKWAKNKGQEGIEEYWNDRNQTSLDGKPTNIKELSKTSTGITNKDRLRSAAILSCCCTSPG
ncbi:pyridoxamine 5'-phosphate oxidase family protein [Endozoicomonas acroporae]|uniref:pyridoxamine 5'-phosphate oxidase family protein n=1 Tax=Endozoicomonas acroporae TaxID=1701104 RepID=UPI003D7AF831